ncbi:LysR family transcriptional regulator [Anaerocolumna aminovalerica]|uniref:DNA-binding transcriptional regulator, LysR family n=1 Tax=Anaerocolumna aminovalerica TaxID=1527 RepID=A0A1I5F061_9FIRM|nr:LysR family transcriptional regulator [Anaerocolumna aminovalerica]SFO17029.1 DNA-binding transcriptional regulator, LysR family [Anaerocolumna aminovalerica]
MEQNLSQYKIFNTVAAVGNISHAAKELYISQPAISKAISRLESDLGVTLFTRTSRGVKLTEEGALFYEYTKSAFDTLSQGEENIKRITQLGIGHLRIGVSTTLCKYILLPFLKEFVLSYPHIKITIECQSTFQTLELLQNKKIDIGLIGKPENRKNLDFYPVMQIEDIFVTTQAYLDNLKIRELPENQREKEKGSRKNSLLSASIFKSATVMLLDEKNMTRIFIDDYFVKNHIETNQILEVSNMDLLIEFAKIGLGVSCVIKEFVQTELKNGLLVEIPLKVPLVKREVGFAFSTNKYLSDSAQKFIKFYQQFKL